MKINKITYLVFKPEAGFPLNFASQFSFMTYNPSKLFQLKHHKLWKKTAHQCSNFQTFESSNESSPTSTCYFWKYKFRVYPILYHSSLSLKISPLYFFSSNLIYFRQKEPIEVKVSNFWLLEWEFKFLMSNLKPASQLFFRPCITLQCHNRSVNFSLDFSSLFSIMTDTSSVVSSLKP